MKPHILIAAGFIAGSSCLTLAQGVTVSAKVTADSQMNTAGGKHSPPAALANVVMWLTPLQPHAPAMPQPRQAGPYVLAQKDKQFIPHLLVVPTGASVEFPNLDPFFHNVFSLFNGKRFDLGLYESGSSRSVRFDREGVSYIFCNIHPEMGAVVLSLSTPFYAISDASGQVVVRNVLPGNYQLNFWSENVSPSILAGLRREVRVGSENQQLGLIPLPLTQNMTANHKNKFGEDYTPEPASPYLVK